MCLCAVFYNMQVILFRNLHNGSHVTRLTVQMHWHNSFRAWSNQRLELCRIHIQRFIDLCQHRHRVTQQDRHNRCNERKARYDHFITRTYPQRRQAAHKRTGAAAGRKQIRLVQPLRHFFFECHDFVLKAILTFCTIAEEVSAV